MKMENKKNRRNSWPKVLLIRRHEDVKEQHKYGISCMPMRNNGRRNTWPKCSQCSSKGSVGQNLPSYPNNDENCFRVKMMKRKINSKVKYIQHKLSPITDFLPVIFAVASIVLNSSDVSTDGLSSHRICTAQCACEYIEAEGPGCDTLRDICSAGIIDGEVAWRYCLAAGSNKTACLNKKTWPVPEKCKCWWYDDSSSKCWAPVGKCSYKKPDGQDGDYYCRNFGKNSKEECEKLPAWEHPESNKFQIRHSFWCTISIGFIAGPSIINNLILLYSLLHCSNYRSYFLLAGLSSLSEITYPFIVCVFIVMGTLQLLPYLCLLLKLMTVWRIYMKTIDEDDNTEDLKYVTLKMMIIFTFTEDLPQCTLQTMFFMRAVHGSDDGILDALSWVAVAGLVTSCLSLSKNYTEYMSAKDSTTSASFTFITVFIAAGGRIMVFCLMVTRLGYEATPVIMTTASLVFGIKIMKYTYESCSKWEECQDLCPNQHLESSESIELQVVNSEVQNISTHEETKWEKLFNLPYKAVRGIQSALTLIILDGQSLNGLWISACFASWASLLKLSYGSTANYDEVTKTTFTFTLISYTLNSITILKKGKNRIQGLLVPLVFFISFLISSQMAPSYDRQSASVLMIPVVSVAGIFLMANIISFVNSKVKSQNNEIEDLA